jgi:mRNA capping enzyme, beta chain
MFYDHPRETDTFYSLTATGEASLPPSIRQYLNPKHRPRVRVTTSQPPGGASAAVPPVVKRRIIKSRIADFDVLCPALAFDYRISISIESPFDGPDDVLVKVNDAGSGGGGDREKDRVSYRHLAYQIDLTQVSYPNVCFHRTFQIPPPFTGWWREMLTMNNSLPNANTSSKSKSPPRRSDRNWRI